MRRTKEEATETRRRLLDAASRAFVARGYGATTLEEVARLAQVTRGAVYHHFGGKLELFAAVVERLGQHRDATIASAVTHGGPILDVFERILERLLRDVEEVPAVQDALRLAAVAFERHPELDDARASARHATRDLIAGMAGFLAEARHSGELAAEVDVEDAARAAVAYHHGLATLWLSDPTAFSLAERAPALAAAFVRGLAAR